MKHILSLLSLSSQPRRTAMPEYALSSGVIAFSPGRPSHSPSAARKSWLSPLLLGVTRLFALVLLFSVSALRAEDAVQPSKIFYPAAAKVTEVTPANSNPIATTMLYIVFLAGLGYATYILWKRKVVPQKTLDTAVGSLDVLTTRPLGSRQFLVVVRYKKQELLLGVGQGFITRLDGDSANTGGSSLRKDPKCAR